jgi:subtilisin family serine protease
MPIVVIDDGLDVTHPAFAGRPETTLLNLNVLDAGDGHGTMVASVAAAPLNGQGSRASIRRPGCAVNDYGAGRAAKSWPERMPPSGPTGSASSTSAAASRGPETASHSSSDERAFQGHAPALVVDGLRARTEELEIDVCGGDEAQADRPL